MKVRRTEVRERGMVPGGFGGVTEGLWGHTQGGRSGGE